MQDSDAESDISDQLGDEPDVPEALEVMVDSEKKQGEGDNAADDISGELSLATEDVVVAAMELDRKEPNSGLIKG